MHLFTAKVAGGLGEFSGTLASVFGVVALVAAALCALQYGTLKTLRESNADLREQHKDDEGRISLRDLELAKVRGEIAEMVGKVQILTEINTQQVSWVAVTDQLEHHHNRAEKHWERDERRWADIQEILMQIRDRLST